MCSSN